MIPRRANRTRQTVCPRVEELETRELTSVTLTPGHINLKSANRSNARMKVRVLSDDPAAANLLGLSPGALTVSVVDAGGVSTPLGLPLKVRSQDITGDGVADLTLTFRRSSLRGLSSGTYQIQVATAGSEDTATGTFSLFSPSKGKGRGHNKPSR